MGSLSNVRSIGAQVQHPDEKTLFVTPTVTAQTTYMTPSDKHVVVTIATAITHIVMLPPVGECAGEIYTIRVPDVGTSCTVVAYGDGSSLDDAVDWTDFGFDADHDNCALLSDGYKWIVLALDEN